MPRIAVVDDDTDFLSYMTDALSYEGWQPLVCSDSLEALGFLRDEQPDVVLLDVRMGTPDSGWEICRFLQLHPATQHIPIIVCSASKDIVQQREDWLREHQIGVLEKPFDLDEMYAMVKDALARAHLATTAPAVSTA